MVPRGQVPEVVEIARLVASSVGERRDLLDSDLVESVDADLAVPGQIGGEGKVEVLRESVVAEVAALSAVPPLNTKCSRNEDRDRPTRNQARQ